MYRIKIEADPNAKRFRWQVWGSCEASGVAPTEYEAWRLAHLAAEGYAAV